MSTASDTLCRPVRLQSLPGALRLFLKGFFQLATLLWLLLVKLPSPEILLLQVWRVMCGIRPLLQRNRLACWESTFALTI